ncbi:MAG TPA: hydrogenase expression/formation protein HypE [Polyangia bacterium]|nr:hydrogenase expression/formation protein HypE [Polyangia bacterium]
MSSDAAVVPFPACPLPLVDTDEVLLGHGSGGRLTAQLVEQLIVPAFRNPALETLDDAALVDAVGDGRRIAFTTDSYVITPIFFRGGDIGELAVNGTINDLAVSGARPLALSLAFILEEGLPLADLRRVIESARAAAARAGVPVVTGDTKVVGRGSADRLFINTSGIGVVPAGRRIGAAEVRAGDAIVVSGTIGDHGVAILSERHGLELDGELCSDTAPLHELAAIALAAAPHLHAMRDPTRGGLAATLVEIASRRGLAVTIDERALPVSDSVRGACEILGLDPLFVANEGKLAAFVPAAEADALVAALRAHPLGRNAARIGEVAAAPAGLVTVATTIGGERIVELPFAEMLPRIC